MKKCFATVPLNNLIKTNKHARKNKCADCNEKYNCLCASLAQFKSVKKWVQDLINDVKEDAIAGQIISEIEKHGLIKACQDNLLIKEYFVSMVKDDYLYHLTNLEVIKDSLKLLGIDIEQELKLKEEEDDD